MVLIKLLVFVLMIVIIPIATWYEKKKHISILLKQIKLLSIDDALVNSICEHLYEEKNISFNIYEIINSQLNETVKNIGVVWKEKNDYKIKFDKKSESGVVIDRKIRSFLNMNINNNQIVLEQKNKQNIVMMKIFCRKEFICLVIITEQKKIDLWNDFVRR